MKTDGLLSFNTICRAVIGVVMSVAVIGTICVAPADALAAPAHRVKRSGRAKQAVTPTRRGVHKKGRAPARAAARTTRHGERAAHAKRTHAAERMNRTNRRAAIRISSRSERAGARKRRMVYTLDGRHRPARVVPRRIAFMPREPDIGRTMGLGNVHDALMLGSSVAYVVDQGTMEPLYDKNSRAVVPIASITKLMTAMVVLDSGASLSEPITVTNADRDFEKGTGSRLAVGSVLSREDMLHIALMASENRAAAALSRYYPGGRPAFIAAMNAKARQLGMTSTHFENSTGLTTQNVSDAYDLVKMVNAAYQYPLIRRFSTDTHYTVFTGRRTLAYRSSNRLIFDHSPGWNIGLQKTGFINESGDCMVMQAMIRGRPVIMVLLDSVGKLTRFADADRVRAWLDHGGDQLPRITSVNTGRAGRDGT